MKFTTLIFLLIVSLPAYSDQPPDWQPYTIYSKNREWTAHISREYEAENPWDDKWSIAVYRGIHYPFPRPDKKPVWSKEYENNGYSEGLLSDDGKAFVYVEYWYRANYPAVKVYTADCAIMKNGSFFNVGRNMKKTVSHELWLKDGSETKFVTIDGRQYVEIETVAGVRHVPVYCGPKT